MRIKKLLANFFEKNEMAWESFMILLAVIFVALGFLPDFIDFSINGFNTLEAMDWGITSFFALEFTTRILVASSRSAYLKAHWLDMVAILPVMRWLRIARLARLIRLLRLVRLARVFTSLDRLGFSLSRFFRLNGLQWMMLTLSAVMLASSVLLFLFEHPVNDKVKSYWDALYASLVTWTTPGYGDIVPITTAGRVFGLVLIISGLIMWAYLSLIWRLF